jgi:UDP:flavonoid glycosyltransferase YjiC (YdhE family)
VDGSAGTVGRLSAPLGPFAVASRASAAAPRRLRVFLGAFGQPGHAFPMLALGERLAQRGHAVTFETWSRWREPVEAAGMEFLAAPEYPVFPSPGQPLKPYEAVLRATPSTRAAVARRRPDVIVHDILTLAPALAGELEGLPVATLVPHLYPVAAPGFPPYAIGARLPRTRVGRAIWRRFERPLERGLRLGRDELNETRRRLGLPALTRLHGGISDRLCLVATLPQLEYPRRWPAHVHVVGPLLWEPPYPDVEPPPGEAPLILVAPSTAQDPSQRMLRSALAGLAGLEVRVLATTNRRPGARPLRAGRRTRLVSWISYSRTMPRCQAVICHAGHGTLARALSCGTPVLAIPHSGDMGENAARLDWAGAGVRLPWRLVGARTIRWSLQRLLDDLDAYTARAGELGAWCAAHDAPTRAAELIEALVTPPAHAILNRPS